jgi:hypothetical protein
LSILSRCSTWILNYLTISITQEWTGCPTAFMTKYISLENYTLSNLEWPSLLDSRLRDFEILSYRLNRISRFNLIFDDAMLFIEMKKKKETEKKIKEEKKK